MARQFGLLGVPSSAGAYTPGIDKALTALCAAGIVEQLQDLERVVDVAANVAQQVSTMTEVGEMPIVIGGDCSITVGGVAL